MFIIAGSFIGGVEIAESERKEENGFLELDMSRISRKKAETTAQCATT